MEEEAQRQQVDWAAIRRAYELTDETIKDICQRFGVTKSALEHRWRKERWLSRQAANSNRHQSTKDRLFALLERQVAKLANETNANLTDMEAEDRAALWTRVGSAEFLSDAEKRAMLGVSG